VAVAAEFMLSAPRPEHFPKPDTPEVALLGRSNVGKSTLLNTLVGRKVAFSSNTPGRTQAANFYRVEGGSFRVVDLPGYGYAKVSRETVEGWKQIVESYLLSRSCLALGILLLDSRRAWMESDLLLKEWLEFHQRRYVVVATKVDKLNQKERNQSQRAIREQYPSGELIWFSAVTGQGVKEVWQTIWKTLNQ